jgi:hypothetical protein
MHDVIVRLFRVQSKGCSSQRSEFCCGNSQRMGWRLLLQPLLAASSKIFGLQPLLRQLRKLFDDGVGVALVLGNFGGQSVDVSDSGTCFLQHGLAQHLD